MTARVWGTVAGAMLGVGLGATAAHNIDNYATTDSYEKASELLHTSQSDKEEAEHNMLRVEQRLGEGCVQLLNVYLPTGVLADTEEETRINDVISEPSQPCGTTRQQSHLAIVSMLQADKILTGANETERLAQKEYSEFRSAAESFTDGDSLMAVASGAVIGGVLLGGLANHIGWRKAEKKKPAPIARTMLYE